MKNASNNPNANQLRLAYTVAETAAQLGVSIKSVYRLVDRGLLHPSRALRTLIFSEAEIFRFLNDTKGGA